MPSKKTEKNSISLDELRNQAIRLCRDNLFLSDEVKDYWLERIPREPRAVVEYLIELFSNFEKDWRGAIHEQLMNDKEGTFKQAFGDFKKSQMRNLSEDAHSSEVEQAEEALEKALDEL